MIGYRSYRSYVDSGLEWLGTVPSHWRLIKNKYIFTEKKETVGENSGEYILLSLTLHGIIPRDMENPSGKFPAEFNTYKIVNPNDIVFCLFDIEETPRTVGHSSHSGMITGAYTVIECNDTVLSRYIYYYHLYLDIDKRLGSLYTGLRKVITRSNFFNIKTPLPPLPEQRAIADFLDSKTAQIEALIKKKQRQLELLQEHRTTLINQAITKGLNPDAPMKDSGIEWLGEVPAYWRIARIKHISLNMISGPFGSSLTKDMYTKNGFRVYGQEQVIPADFTIGDYYISEQKYLEMQRYAVSPSDVLISCVGTFGKIAVVPNDVEPGIINPRLIKVSPNRNLVAPNYLGEALSSKLIFEQLERVSRGGTMGVINLGLLSEILIPLPPLDEQEEILSFLKNKKTENKITQRNIDNQASLLNEYRTALISAAVTGKIDVRAEGS